MSQRLSQSQDRDQKKAESESNQSLEGVLNDSGSVNIVLG